jgi:uncharacterized delta-60 repeat protein
MKTILSFCVGALFICYTTNTTAQPANLDPSFAKNGIGIFSFPITEFDALCQFSVLQADGKIIMGGYTNSLYILIRLNADGTTDSSYGTDGKVELNKILGYYSDNTKYNAVIQPDGKLIIFGGKIIRLNTDGSLDNSFGNNGIFSDDSCSVNIATIQNDGKIVAAGDCSLNDFDVRNTVMRLNNDGSFDNSFDGDGKKQFDYKSGNEYDESRKSIRPVGITIYPNGKILITDDYEEAYWGGWLHDLWVETFQFTLYRLNTDGSLDNSFGDDGYFRASFNNFDNNHYIAGTYLNSNGKIIAGFDVMGYDNVIQINDDGSYDYNFNDDGISTGDWLARINSMAIQPDGKILLAGSDNDYTDYNYCVVRMNTNGTIDNSFGVLGKQSIPFTDAKSECTSVLVLKNGKIFLSGNVNTNTDQKYYSAVRLKNNGALDNSFDKDGKEIITPGSLDDACNAAALTAGGNLVFAGSSFEKYNQNASVGRLQNNGKLDNSFDGDGAVNLTTYPLQSIATLSNGKILTGGAGYISRLRSNGNIDSGFGINGLMDIPIDVNTIALQGDGKIIAAGKLGNEMKVVRLTPTGYFDNSFDADGEKIIAFSFSNTINIAYATAIQPDGKILIAGTTGSIANGYDFAIARINTDGSFDNSFDGDGKVTVHISGDDFCYAMKLQADGKIVLAGSSGTGKIADFSVIRLSATGVLDTRFGKKLIAVGLSVDIAKGLAIQADGKIILGGYSFNGLDNDPSIVRLNSSGSPDNTFDGDGKKIYSMPGTDETINAVVLQADGKIILAGRKGLLNSDYLGRVLVMRLLGGNTAAIATQQSAIQTHTHVADLSLKQNFPNPFKNTTTINYTLPSQYSNAKIIVTDNSGKAIKEIQVTAGSKSVQVDLSSFAAGVYNYSLYAGNNRIASLQMIQVK